MLTTVIDKHIVTSTFLLIYSVIYVYRMRIFAPFEIATNHVVGNGVLKCNISNVELLRVFDKFVTIIKTLKKNFTPFVFYTNIIGL